MSPEDKPTKEDWSLTKKDSSPAKNTSSPTKKTPGILEISKNWSKKGEKENKEEWSPANTIFNNWREEDEEKNESKVSPEFSQNFPEFSRKRVESRAQGKEYINEEEEEKQEISANPSHQQFKHGEPKRVSNCFWGFFHYLAKTFFKVWFSIKIT